MACICGRLRRLQHTARSIIQKNARRPIMAIGLLATITVLVGKNEAFEQTFLDLTEKVRANEPGNVFYALS